MSKKPCAGAGSFDHRPIPEPVPVLPDPAFGFIPPAGFALLGGPELALPLELEAPSLGPLLPVVLGFVELPVVVELAAGPPEAELPPAELPAPEPALCAKANDPDNTRIEASVSVLSFMGVSLWNRKTRQREAVMIVPAHDESSLLVPA
jgi:hypothetical protein